MEELLLQHFQLPGFRPCQREAVEATLQRKDSLVILPTGAGKARRSTRSTHSMHVCKQGPRAPGMVDHAKHDHAAHLPLLSALSL